MGCLCSNCSQPACAIPHKKTKFLKLTWYCESHMNDPLRQSEKRKKKASRLSIMPVWKWANGSNFHEGFPDSKWCNGEEDTVLLTWYSSFLFSPLPGCAKRRNSIALLGDTEYWVEMEMCACGEGRSVALLIWVSILFPLQSVRVLSSGLACFGSCSQCTTLPAFTLSCFVLTFLQVTYRKMILLHYGNETSVFKCSSLNRHFALIFKRPLWKVKGGRKKSKCDTWKAEQWFSKAFVDEMNNWSSLLFCYHHQADYCSFHLKFVSKYRPQIETFWYWYHWTAH